MRDGVERRNCWPSHNVWDNLNVWWHFWGWFWATGSECEVNCGYGVKKGVGL